MGFLIVESGTSAAGEFVNVRFGILILLSLLSLLRQASAQPVRTVFDPLGDTRLRRVDPFAGGFVDEANHALPDLLGYQIGRWSATAPASNLFAGTWSLSGGYMRLDLRFSGVVNPPGPLAQSNDDYYPYFYGPSPVFGYVEIDMDNRVGTGGETAFPRQRYLSNAARFGGKPSAARFADRVALNPEDFDNDPLTAPFFERSGEEFHLALFADKITSIVVLVGDGDGIFEAGERWLVRGRLFHRAHGYEHFSNAGGDGVYEPLVSLIYEHFPITNTTVISLVFPLTNYYSALSPPNGNPSGAVEPNDGNDSNQASVEEALENLIQSANSVAATGGPLVADPSYPLLEGWGSDTASPYLNPPVWDVTCIVGMAYVFPQAPGVYVAYTDVTDDPLPGDFNGDGHITCVDDEMLATYLWIHDGPNAVSGGDGAADGVFHIGNFGPSFSVFDLDYDGTVSGVDASLVVRRGDLDDDCDVDPDDIALFAAVLTRPDSFSAAELDFLTMRSDFTEDGAADGSDISGFVQRILSE